MLQSIAGTAPVSYQSGKINKVRVRWACDKFLRHTVHLWADCFRKSSAWGQAYYQQKRQEGMSHACALRCLGQRLLKIVFRMIADQEALRRRTACPQPAKTRLLGAQTGQSNPQLNAGE